jgi:prepilin-type N-terminal cleavage/methylation domain-containing protein
MCVCESRILGAGMDLEAVRLSTHLARASGLTLLEILVVVGILAILLSIGFPQYAGYQRGLVMRDVSNQIAQLLRETGAQAKAETTALTVNFLLDRADGDDLMISDGKTATKTIRLERDASLKSVFMGGTAKTSVTFDVRGRPNNPAPLVITAGFADRIATVRLLTTGKTVIQ